MTVVLLTGEILRTNAGGSNAHRRCSVITAEDGPSLTPLFIGDGGSLGIKAEVTLALVPAPSDRLAGHG